MHTLKFECDNLEGQRIHINRNQSKTETQEIKAKKIPNWREVHDLSHTTKEKKKSKNW